MPDGGNCSDRDLTTITMNNGGKKILKNAARLGRDIWNRNANRDTPSSRNGLYLIKKKEINQLANKFFQRSPNVTLT